ncbi:MAG TPA: T9SS type A sorting domain-containing protein [Pelobium sp.]|nr:T9SS type A sorting domain-containing protein [Pelobium sp.]
MKKIFTRLNRLFYFSIYLTLLPTISWATTIDLGGDLSSGKILFQYNFGGTLNSSLFSISGFSQTSNSTEIQLTPNQIDWKSQFLTNQTFQRVEGLTFEGSVFIPQGHYKAVMVGFHDGVNNGTDGIEHGLYFFDNGGGIEVQARSGTNAQNMPTLDYDNSSSPGSWMDYKIVLHTLGATYYVKRSTESSYTNTLNFDGGNNLSELKVGIQGNRTTSATNNYTSHKNWKVSQPRTLYVNKNVTGGNGTGDSWENAVPELADALNWANQNKSNWTTDNPLRIWVAGGTYKPLYDYLGTANGKENTFLLVKNVQIFGGFAGTESNLQDRDLSLKSNASILSGDVNGDDTVTGIGETLSISNNSENNYHVVIGAGDVETALLDGFRITGGNANASGSSSINSELIYKNRGGGIYCRKSSPAIKNVVITANTATSYGGGSYNDDNSSATFLNTAIFKNMADKGAGMCNDTSIPAITNVTITDNKSTGEGGGIANYDASPQIKNSIIYGNDAVTGQQIYNNNSTPSFSYSLVAGSGGSTTWQSTLGTDGGNNVDDDPIFFNQADGHYTPKSTSPVLDQGFNQSYTDAGGYLTTDMDLAGNLRVRNTTIDMGAYEFYPQQPTLTNFPNIMKTASDDDFVLTAPTSNSSGAFSYSSSDVNVAAISGNTVSIIGVGTATITATQAATADYQEATIQLTLTVENTLPVLLTNFTVKAEGNNAILRWQTASETDNESFVIYRSGDDGVFIKLGSKKGAGTSKATNSYVFYDHAPLKGNNYYQLVQVDLDGKETDLGVKQVTFDFQPTTLNLYPNPTTDKVNIAFEAGKFNSVLVSDLNGRTLQQLALSKTENNLMISLGSYSSGTYIIRLNGNGHSQIRKVVKK